MHLNGIRVLWAEKQGVDGYWVSANSVCRGVYRRVCSRLHTCV